MMPVSKATRDSLRTYAQARSSYNGDISIGSKLLIELINDLHLSEMREKQLQAALDALIAAQRDGNKEGNEDEH